MTADNEPLKTGIDKVRASRDGHFYHETWAAHVALELLRPTSTLRILTMEGFSIEDESSFSEAATEIADLVRYRGGVNVDTASSVEVLQFKYSIARADQEVRAFDIKKTLEKFAATDVDFIKRIGNDRVESVVRYEIVTNRPFSPALITAIQGLCDGQSLDGDAADQAKYIKETLPDLADALPDFLGRITLSGSQGTLAAAEALVHRTLADWTTPNDPQTKTRLDDLRNLVRDKAGSKGQGNNEIDRVALLACLGVYDERDLFPTPDAFPKIPAIVERPVIGDLVEQINKPGHPLLYRCDWWHGENGLNAEPRAKARARKCSSTLRLFWGRQLAQPCRRTISARKGPAPYREPACRPRALRHYYSWFQWR
jgi:hypothetical protein